MKRSLQSRHDYSCIFKDSLRKKKKKTARIETERADYFCVWERDDRQFRIYFIGRTDRIC